MRRTAGSTLWHQKSPSGTYWGVENKVSEETLTFYENEDFAIFKSNMAPLGEFFNILRLIRMNEIKINNFRKKKLT